MLTKTITYTDFNDNERTEDFYFHLSEREIMNLHTRYDGGLDGAIEAMVQANDIHELLAILQEIILMSYGVKSADGKSFIKSDEVKQQFEYSAAFSELYLELLSDEQNAVDFIKNLLPTKAQKRIDELEAESKHKPDAVQTVSVPNAEQVPVEDNGSDEEDNLVTLKQVDFMRSKLQDKQFEAWMADKVIVEG